VRQQAWRWVISDQAADGSLPSGKANRGAVPPAMSVRQGWSRGRAPQV